MEIFQFAIAGGLAQMVDGTLGMAFGVISSTLLVALGAAPVGASMATHFAKFGTCAASGVAHWRAGNVDKSIVFKLGLGGSIGAIFGAGVLVHASTSNAAVWMSALLLFLGVLIILRFGADIRLIPSVANPNASMLVPLGLIGGFVDATGGGGWGPVTTPTLLMATEHEPRMVIGTVNAAEFIVATSATITFLFTASLDGMVWAPVIGLIVGGVTAAPIAARLAGRFPHAPLGTLVGGLVVLTNLRTILMKSDVAGNTIALSLLFVLAATIAMAIAAWRRGNGVATAVEAAD